MEQLKENIKILRERTGAGFLDCKNALSENNNDIEQSIDFLRKKGLAKANKKANRDAKDGVIAFFSNEKKAILIKINTETDFAAKSDIFLDFVDHFGNIILNLKNDCNVDQILESESQGKKISDYLKEIISKVGENIILSNIKYLDVLENSNINFYVHSPYRKNIGKIISLLSYSSDADTEKHNIFSKNLCMHIAASKPEAINKDSLDLSLIEKEKEIQSESIKSSGKPKNIIEKILEGKINKFINESTLVNQNYIMNPEITVQKAIDEFNEDNNFKILKYIYENLE